MLSWPSLCVVLVLVLLQLTAASLTLRDADADADDQALSTDLRLKSLSRQRRFLFPQASGWTLTASFTLSVPLEDVGSSVTINVPFTYAFDTGTVTGRSFDGSRSFSDRRRVYNMISTTLSQFGVGAGLDGHACLLRTLCEVAQVPAHSQGLLGDAINLLLSPRQHPLHEEPNGGDDGDGYDEYVAAQRQGALEQDCTQYQKNCHVSLFQIFSDQDNELMYTPADLYQTGLNYTEYDHTGPWHQYESYL